MCQFVHALQVMAYQREKKSLKSISYPIPCISGKEHVLVLLVVTSGPLRGGQKIAMGEGGIHFALERGEGKRSFLQLHVSV